MRFNLTPEEIESLINPDKNGNSEFFSSLSRGIGQREYEDRHLYATLYELEGEYESLLQGRSSTMQDVYDNVQNDFSRDTRESILDRRDRIDKQIKTLDEVRGEVYFGRIDVEDDEYGYNSYYIGKKGVNSLEIVDWRAPMGLGYYQKSDREFTVSVDGGTYKYSVRLRRALTVRGDSLVSMHDEYVSTRIPSGTHAVKPVAPSVPPKAEKPRIPTPAPEKKESAVFDPYLLEIVKSRKEKDRATDIIESIQEKQIEIISLPESDEFVVQGVAGSGKTMIMLHRLSRLMFNNHNIRPSGVLIITPTDSFNGFIYDLSEILELDKVKTSTLFEYYVDLLESADVDIANKIDPGCRLTDKYLGYIYSEDLPSDVERIVHRMYDNFYAMLTEGKKSPRETILAVLRRLREDFSQIEKANDRVRLCILGEIKVDADGKTFYAKRMRELMGELNVLNEFLQTFYTDRNLKTPSSFLTNFCTFAKSLKYICGNCIFICNHAAEDLAALSLEVKSEIDDLSRSDKDRRERLEQVLNEIKREGDRLSSMKDQFTLIFNASAELRGSDDFNSLSRCDGIRDIAMLFYNKLISTKKQEHGIDAEKYNTADPYVLCQIFSQMKYPMTPNYLYLFIDEGQDISVSEYRLLKSLNPNAKFNVYGDLQQNMTPWRGMRDWKGIGLKQYSIYANYRNTNEIINYVADNLGVKMTSIGLDGRDVRRIDMSEAENFLSAKKGLRAIICSQERVTKLKNEKYNVSAETGNISRSTINLMSVYESKGLEFTAVVVVDDDLTDNEKYIAYTRALSDLAVMEYKEPDTKYEDVEGEDEADDCKLCFDLGGNGYVLTGLGDCLDTDVVIPSKYKKLPVVEVGDSAFCECMRLKSVVIPDSVTSIGKNAFYKCKSLKSVTMGAGVVSIGDGAFYSCMSLTVITIPKRVRSIGKDAFNYCASLKETDISDLTAWLHIDFKGLTSNPLYYARKLCLNGVPVTNLVIPKSVDAVRDYAFCKCSSIVSLKMNRGVLSIGSFAFTDCSSLKDIKITAGTIGQNAFADCRLLGSMAIGDGTRFISDYAFLNCDSFESIIIPESVSHIGYGAFSGCKGLKKVFFGGNKEEWDRLSNQFGENAALKYARRFLYSKEYPNRSGNFWFYGGDGKPRPW